MRGTEFYIGKVSGWLMAALWMLGAVGCEADWEPDGRSPREGVFVVDYLPKVGPDTKSVQDGLSKNQRISSLTYLLYWDNKLLKRREIPDIGPNTTWPLRRETMTWGQREALKDTLRQDRTYQIAFVANLAGRKDADGNAVAPLKQADTYDKVYIELPAAPFENDNMFYLFTTDLSSQTQGADRDHPYQCPVLLRRIVTRLDFWGERLPQWIDQPAAGEKNPAEVYIDDYGFRLMLNLCFGKTDAFVADALKGGVQTFWTQIGDDFRQQASDWGLVGGLLNPDSISKLNGFADKCYKLATSSSSGTYHQTLLSSDTLLTRLGSTLLADCMKNAVLKDRFSQRWAGKAGLDYLESSGANQFYLSNWHTKGEAHAVSVRMPVDTACVIQGRDYDGFTWVGFGRNQGADADPTNQVDRLCFYGEDGKEYFAIEARECTTGQTGNLHYQAIYTPIDSLLCTKATQTRPYRFMANMKSLFLEGGDNPDLAFVKAIQETLEKPATEPVKAYGNDLEAIPLDVRIPDLSDTQTLIIKSRWTVRAVTK
ncbi:hypothetical protein AAH029_19730 [Parabacteroides distasonis]|uniref:hypothetical protein n=1 Tax=Parabacteroides distasonis TaxID=823 RepID=UPI0039B651BA